MIITPPSTPNSVTQHCRLCTLTIISVANHNPVTQHGRTYFAEDACKSNQYSSAANPLGERVIIYARVLVGDARCSSFSFSHSFFGTEKCVSLPMLAVTVKPT
jgi:hypothetical protein